ncbi:cystatin-12-like [Meriones unguiculatus]|uniref:cystatin-12-like n=1 Tax=Meriones unguiculatus TaxID=10047 RepID=UPI000B4EC182|nr:cystatin-12-like [Meriones unguiculatus]
MLWKVDLVMGLIVLAIHDCNLKFIDIHKDNDRFVISVEHVLHHFNENHVDDFAYKLLKVWRSQRERYAFIYLVDLEMGRTTCGKHDEDIDNCPLQEGQEEKKVRCTYILKNIVWVTQFVVLNSTCAQA